MLHVPACPNLGPAIARLREAVADTGVAATVRVVEIATAAAAVRAGMRGSPTILIDGEDPFPVGSDEPSLSCRLYESAGGLDGSPSVAQLREALSHVMNEQGDLRLDKASAVAALSAAGRDVHRAVLDRFAETGRPPTRAELEERARRHDADPQRVLAELVERDVTAFDPAGEIRAAYPYSPTPTAIHVLWDGGPGVHAMCAIDALGMSAMLHRPVTIVAAEPGGVGSVTVTVDGNEARWNPESAVVFAGATGNACCPSADRTCGNINFFTNGQAAHKWAAGHPAVTGFVLTIPEALARGVAEFGPLLVETHTSDRK